MNNPFEDLMYRSGLTAQGCWDSLDDYDKRAVHKFAELIVRECGKVIDDHYEPVYDGNFLKHHFGIEE